MDIPIASSQFHSAQLKELVRLVPQIMWSSRSMTALANIDLGGAAIPLGGGGGSAVWGGIIGTLSNQTDLQNALNAINATVATKQNTLVSGTTIKTINGNSLLGSGDLVISGGGGGTWGSITGTLSSQTDLQNALNLKANLISPSFTTPNLGVPSAGNLSSCTGYAAGNLAGLGANVAGWLATPSSANLLAALTTKTGTGNAVFGTAPSISAPTISGVSTISGSEINVGTAVSSNVIDSTVVQNDYTFSADATCSISGSPVTGTVIRVLLIGDATADRTLTLPVGTTFRSQQLQASILSFVVPQNYRGYWNLVKTAAGYDSVGEPQALSDREWNLRLTNPSAGNRIIVLSARAARRIKSIYAKTTVGTIDVKIQINGVDVTGGGLTGISTSGSNSNATAARDVAIGNVVQLVIANPASTPTVDITIGWIPLQA